MKLVRCLLLLGLVGVWACSKSSDSESPTGSFSLENFCRHWVHSVEEQQSLSGPEEIYRPDGSREFPPSMYRNHFIFERNGSMQYLWPSPADAHEMRPGTWKIDAQQNDVIHIQEGDQELTYQVLEAAAEILRLRLVEQ
ncbi:MAG TPA: hypothetical protein VFR10_10810 [bacterium]|nr:hypothetical protein [bacterium]